jgi:hypothetical protein
MTQQWSGLNDLLIQQAMDPTSTTLAAERDFSTTPVTQTRPLSLDALDNDTGREKHNAAKSYEVTQVPTHRQTTSLID